MSASLLIVVVLLQVFATSPIDAATGTCSTCTLPTSVAAAIMSNATASTATLTPSIDPITGCKIITVTCQTGFNLLQISTTNVPFYTPLAVNNVFRCNVAGVGYESPQSPNTITDIVCYQIPCSQTSSCSPTLIGLNLGNPNPCDETQLTTVVAPSISTGCNDLYVSCPAGSSLSEILINGTGLLSTGVSSDIFVCQLSPPGWISNVFFPIQAVAAFCVNPNIATSCLPSIGPLTCPIPQSCTVCGPTPCALLNYPNTNIALQINPQFTFNNQPYSSSIFANGLAECGNDPFTTLFPTATNTSVQAVLSSGQFIGIFTCPFAMCVCTDGSNGTIDCYRGNSTVQILLVPVLTPAPNSFPVILGVVLQSNISTPFANWGPPSNLANPPPLAQGNYIKINHLACVPASSASSPAICPAAVPV